MVQHRTVLADGTNPGTFGKRILVPGKSQWIPVRDPSPKGTRVLVSPGQDLTHRGKTKAQ